ncbi:single-stranded-DNA-specific exonuclease RecJ [Hydrogenophaga sp.]|uniref:single-stranded-DNA-specific exonuclease RecJ n=1 Tax=Hydrogenophaga sp. TaxID=1904254 RepID=UPI0025BD5248|nr:single-stranded-DNA-specific exonuclease RecJ [Hydrogenophaga sp.]MDO9504656.1 single-stranded-DNA-specific exonuclease RecJ [Hydrogenophaga sp.]MDP3627556.1 single-stranded-DNA-specific exonuclease RecJ [Hydrogenophaga sp.]MDZ4399029.1 single-stranded-DNA-specific exonuclease RecJ [Hydrogenophaga sp.]
MKIITRDVPPRAAWALEQGGLHPLLARLFAARGITSTDELDDALARLIPPSQMLGAQDAARALADAMAANKAICIVADYDCDGATACAVGLRGLRLLGAPMGFDRVNYLVPDRVTDGYGLTPSISKRVKAQGADVLVTVDNGIASVEGVRAARDLGLQVIVTDHHLPAIQNGEVVLPQDCIIVNPNQPGCGFESKSIAGVGVMFYVLLALRAELRERGVFTAQTQPKIDALLPLVALGTVADVVKLDANNRRLVAQGLKRVRAGAMPPGMTALFNVAARKPDTATGFDFGFALGPRLNAAGRLADMTLGIECLTTDDALRADELARTLDGINRERKLIEGDMREQALQMAEEMFDESEEPPPALIVFDPDFHEGVVGIVASRLKDKLHRPTFVFAASGAEGKENELKGSGRSIAGFHLRDALDLVAKRHPGVLLRFGGHAMAAGCTIDEEHLETFEAALQQVAHEWLDAATLQRRIEADGALDTKYRRADLVDTLHKEVWGQGFAPPVFCEEVQVVSQRLVGEKHLALKLKHQGEPVDGIWFGHTEPLPARVKIAFRLDADEWQGQRRVRFLVEAAEV